MLAGAESNDFVSDIVSQCDPVMLGSKNGDMETTNTTRGPMSHESHVTSHDWDNCLMIYNVNVDMPINFDGKITERMPISRNIFPTKAPVLKAVLWDRKLKRQRERERPSKRPPFTLSSFTSFLIFSALFCAFYSYGQLHWDSGRLVISSKVSLEGNSQTEPHFSCLGKEKYLKILQQSASPGQLSTETICKHLPSEQQVMNLYGDSIVHGLETCQSYRSRLVSTKNTTLSPLVKVTGLFNTGTNAFSTALHVNLMDNIDGREIEDQNDSGIEMR